MKILIQRDLAYDYFLLPTADIDPSDTDFELANPFIIHNLDTNTYVLNQLRSLLSEVQMDPSNQTDRDIVRQIRSLLERDSLSIIQKKRSPMHIPRFVKPKAAPEGPVRMENPNEDWIEIHVVDQFDNPFDLADYQIVFPRGSGNVEEKLNKEGIIKFEKIEKGYCQLDFTLAKKDKVENDDPESDAQDGEPVYTPVHFKARKAISFEVPEAREGELAPPPEKSTPRLTTPSSPETNETSALDGFQTYVVLFHDDGSIEKFHACIAEKGYLMKGKARLKLPCEKEFMVYCTHRTDDWFTRLNRAELFKQDCSALNLLGPFTLSPGEEEQELEINIWEQNDWVLVEKPNFTPDDDVDICLGVDHNAFQIYFPFNGGFSASGDNYYRDKQEHWGASAAGHPVNPQPLIRIEGASHMWAGTCSFFPPNIKSPESPYNAAKLLIRQNYNFIGSIQSVPAPENDKPDSNQTVKPHQQYNKELVEQLQKISRYNQEPEAIASLPEPPDAYALEGDICWHNQGATNHCGAFSFAAVMNYWYPFTSHPQAQNGFWYADDERVNSTINDARLPADIVESAQRFHMNARDFDAEELEQEQALKLLKSWLSANIPVLVLVEEMYDVWSLHWKVLVGYDSERFFFLNSGLNAENYDKYVDQSIDYTTIPVGNDVDGIEDFWKKWSAVGTGKNTEGWWAGVWDGFISTIMDITTSMDSCTFIPIFPKASEFGEAPVFEPDPTITIRIPVHPDTPKEQVTHERFILMSDDDGKSYREERTILDDTVPFNGQLDFKFTNLIQDQTYSLWVKSDDDNQYKIFSEVTYEELVTTDKNTPVAHPKLVPIPGSGDVEEPELEPIPGSADVEEPELEPIPGSGDVEEPELEPIPEN